jgi:hypothetical protein
MEGHPMLIVWLSQYCENGILCGERNRRSLSGHKYICTQYSAG